VPEERPPVPKGFDWQLWLGPERDRPYHPCYTHTVFRGWYDFGGGSFADMGIYSLWPVFDVLRLGSPASAEALATHTCEIVGNVSRVRRNDVAYPTASMQRFQFAACGDLPAIELFWYDGGMRPRLPEEVERHGVSPGREGILFVGERGSILAGFLGQNPELFAGGKRQRLDFDGILSDADKERLRAYRRRHLDYWLAELEGGPRSPGSFITAAAISDTHNLGTVALRARQKVLFDGERMKVTSPAGADKFLYRQYRPGWEL